MDQFTSSDGEALQGVVRALLADLAGSDVDDLAPDATMADLDLDSLDAGEFLVQLEGETGVRLDVRRLGEDWSRLTVAQLTTLIGRQHHRDAPDPR